MVLEKPIGRDLAASQDNFNTDLALANVACVGGSWIVPSGDIETGDWEAITRLAAEAAAVSRRPPGSSDHFACHVVDKVL